MKIISLNLVIIQFYFQCLRLMMNKISTSSGLSTERASQKDEELVTNKKSKLRSKVNSCCG